MLFATLFVASLGGSHASLHPAQADWFVEIPDFEAVLAAYDEAPLVRLAHDPDLVSCCQTVSSALEDEISSGLEDLGRELGLGGDTLRALPAASLAWLGTLDSFSLSVAGWTSGVDLFEERAARWREAEAGLQRLAGAIDAYQSEHGSPPDELAAIPGLDSAWTLDPWGRAYAYEPGGPAGYTLTCRGADGQPGGQGDAADLEAREPLRPVLVSLREAIPLGMQALAVLRFQEDGVARASADRLTELLASTGAKIEASSLRLEEVDARVRRFEFDVSALGSEPPAVWIADGPRFLIVGGGSGRASDLEARAAGRTRSLADTDRYQNAYAGLETAPGGVLVAQGFERLSLLEALAMLGEIQDQETVRHLLGLVSNRTEAAWTTHLREGGFETRKFATSARETPLGSLVAVEPVHLELIDSVPDDAVMVSTTTANWSGLFELAADMARKEGGAGVAEALDGTLERWKTDFGLDVADFVASLGPGVCMYMQPIAIGVPNAGALVEVRDAAAFERGLTGLSALVAAQTGGGFSFEPRAYKKVPVWTLRRTREPLPWGGQAAAMVDQAFGGMMAPSPSVALLGDRAVIGLTAVQVKRMIRRAADEDRELHPFRARAEDAGDASFAYTIDWAGIWLGAYRMGRSFLTMSQGFAGDEGLPFDPAELPDPETMAVYFEPTVGWSRPAEGGEATFQRSSFGPEIWLGAVVPLGAGLVGARQQSQAHDAARAALSSVRGRQIVDAVRKYAILNDGDLPGELSELLAADESGEPYLATVESLEDGWGHAFRYEPKADRTFRLWSLGPNGIDEGGDGDDVVIQ